MLIDVICCGCLFGWLKGDIYLPTKFATTGSAEQRKAILTHELAHVARWDAGANLIQMTVQAVFFFHPLVWLANKMVRQEREKCCDEVVLASSVTLPQTYCEAIVAMLDGKNQLSHPQPVLAVGGSTKNIEERIMTILSPKRKFSRGPSISVAVLLLVIATLLLPSSISFRARVQSQEPAATSHLANAKNEAGSQSSKRAASDQDSKKESTGEGDVDWKSGQEMNFQVINAVTKEPIEGVSLELQLLGQGHQFFECQNPNHG